MSKIRFPLIAASLMAASLLFTSIGYGAQAASSAPVVLTVNQINESISVKEQAQRWAEELSAEERYQSWRNAKVSVTPMGPGTHSWLVQLTQDGSGIVGYIVIYATEDGGFQLGEYGIGAYPLFNEQALQLSLLQLELDPNTIKAERVYGDALHAAWRITTKRAVYYTDAMSGEGLPIEKEQDWEDEQKTTSASAEYRYGLSDKDAKLEAQYELTAAFDPYGRMPWLTKEPMDITNSNYTASLLKAIQSNKEIRYTAESYKGKLRQVWSVIGYDVWEGDQIYLALDTDEESADRRYIPIELLIQEGHFYA